MTSVGGRPHQACCPDFCTLVVDTHKQLESESYFRTNGINLFLCNSKCTFACGGGSEIAHGMRNEVAALKKRGYTYSMLLAKYKEHTTDE